MPCRLDYSYIAFIGVDLGNAGHFYTGTTHVKVLGVFEASVLAFATQKYNNSMHATASRGVHHFIGRLATERHDQVRFINLSPQSLLANMTGLTTVRPNALLRCCGRRLPSDCESCVHSYLARCNCEHGAELTSGSSPSQLAKVVPIVTHSGLYDDDG